MKESEQRSPTNIHGGSIPLTRYAGQNRKSVSASVSGALLLALSFIYLSAAITPE